MVEGLGRGSWGRVRSRARFWPTAVLLLCYRRAMAVRKKRSISLPPDLDDQIAAAAEQAGVTYSAWLAATARKEFTLRAGLLGVAEYENDHGTFTADELADADAWAERALRRAGGTSARRTA
jgi:hypothetical protein